jgi:hypothetical protein
MEVVPHVGNPHTPVVAVVDPASIRAQFIVEDVEIDAPIVIVVVIRIGVPIFIGITFVVVTLRICASGGVAGR